MHGMMKIISNVKDFYNEINGATLTGAIDVVVVEQPDGNFNCSPFHVRFGKLGVLRSKEKVVDVEINGEPQEIQMKLGESGEAFFVEEVVEDDENEIPEHLATSPIPVSEFENIFKNQRRRLSFDFEDISKLNLENQQNDYSIRRNTTENENTKTRERNFIKRQIGLGNIDIGENSAEEMTLSMISGKHSSEDLSRSHNDISETIFKMDSLDMESSKADDPKSETVSTPTPVKSIDEVPSDSKNSNKKRRKRVRRKNAPRKSTSINQMQISQTSENLENNETVTDKSSLDSTSSDQDVKNMQQKVSKTEDENTRLNDSSNLKKIDADFHFFSDTELTSNGVIDSRSENPSHIESVLSDSEFEFKIRKEEPMDNGKSWEWGEFPSVSQNNSPANDNPREERRSMLSGMFSFMKQKHGTQTQLKGGMYLSDITSGQIDQEVAEIYFNQTKEKKDVDMDCESGNGPSLAQSPNSAEGCKSVDSDFEEQTKIIQSGCQDISLSLCGWDPEPDSTRFLEHVVKFSDLCNTPVLFENPNLVVRIKDKYYNWKVAAPIIASFMIYGRPLLKSSIDQLCNMHMPAALTSKDFGPKQQQETKSSWWSWRRGKTSRETTPAPEKSTESEKTVETKDVTDIAEVAVEVVAGTETTVSETVGTKEETILQQSTNSNNEKRKKTLRLSSKQIASLNLRDGVNKVEFSVTTAYQGTTRCECYLYKWKWDDKIVISDIDGTITKSDVLGHILPIVGKDWAQTGVAQLFNKIKDNGYKLLYLSARAIGQARITRDYLKSIKQGDLTMPDGPVLLNPTSLITAFHREVIERKPEQFKISCMSDIKALFPSDSNPFYAGYGNRINDVWAYTAVGIPIVRIFTINPQGELKHELTETFQSSYSNMSIIVDQLFPSRLDAANDYSQNIYWRDPILPVEDLLD
ncbi:phosphatidate phosphatase LPIN [Leptinotarsa decemlineata]|uniref:phosphatidate phosphatase LPIN n=1 Tax=Leptinotarsa decemlineata TaxID=7539 RepID=UPI003D308C7D